MEDNKDELTHHGIKGMKWGKRRFQNVDGELTAAGRERYGVGKGRDDSSDNSDRSKSGSSSYGLSKLNVGRKNRKRVAGKREIDYEDDEDKNLSETKPLHPLSGNKKPGDTSGKDNRPDPMTNGKQSVEEMLSKMKTEKQEPEKKVETVNTDSKTEKPKTDTKTETVKNEPKDNKTETVKTEPEETLAQKVTRMKLERAHEKMIDEDNNREFNKSLEKMSKKSDVLNKSSEVMNRADNVNTSINRIRNRKKIQEEMDSMSNEELRKRNERQALENTYKQNNANRMSKGHQFVSDVLTIGSAAASVAATALTIAKLIKEIKGNK